MLWYRIIGKSAKWRDTLLISDISLWQKNCSQKYIAYKNEKYYDI